MKKWLLIALVALAPLALGNGGLPSDLLPPIEDYLGGTSDMTQKLEEALSKYQGPDCQLPGNPPGLVMRQAYDALVWVGEILCSLKITCFTRYVRDFFPLGASESDLLDAFASGKDALMYGRWYQLYRPLELLGQSYAQQKKSRGLDTAESPTLLLAYPDVRYGEKSTYVGEDGNRVDPPRGDGDVLGQFQEGNLVFHLAFSASTLDQVDLAREDAGEIAKALAVSLAPGVVFVSPLPGSGRPPRTFLVVGSTAPSDLIGNLQPPPECMGQSNDIPKGNYWEMVGRVPYFWNSFVGMVLPLARTLAEFAQNMEKQERQLKGGEP